MHGRCIKKIKNVFAGIILISSLLYKISKLQYSHMRVPQCQLLTELLHSKKLPSHYNTEFSAVLWNFSKNVFAKFFLGVVNVSTCTCKLMIRFCFNAVFGLTKWSVPGDRIGTSEIRWNIVLKKTLLKSLSSTYCWNNFYINLLKTIRNPLYLRNQFVPRSKLFPSRL